MTSPGSFRPQLDQAVGGLRVTKENVLFVRDAIAGEARRLQDDIHQHRTDLATLPEFGGDPVSRDASRAFPDRAGRLLEQCSRYASDLLGAAQALDDTARHYGITEAEITGTLHAPPSATPPQAPDAVRGSDVGQLLTSLTTAPTAPAAPPTGVPGLISGAAEILDPGLQGPR